MLLSQPHYCLRVLDVVPKILEREFVDKSMRRIRLMNAMFGIRTGLRAYIFMKVTIVTKSGIGAASSNPYGNLA